MKINTKGKSFIPKTLEEKDYVEKLQKILEHKRYGDWDLVAKDLNISKQIAIKSFERIYSKKHFEVVESLKRVIDNRRSLLLKNE